MPIEQLRRKDRETSLGESEELLRRALVGRIGTVSPGGIPYVVPMNFVYDVPARTIYLHLATTGHLLDNLSSSSQACFEVDEPGEIIATGPAACDTSHVYQSVICFGEAQVVAEEQARSHALQLFVEKYVDGLMPGREYAREMNSYHETAVIAMRVDRMTGKRRPSPSTPVS